jgi:tRNA pseudouridine38-40 synthase
MSNEKIRVALKLAYLGQNYHGFQRQPQVPTVEAAVREALGSLGLAGDGFCYGGRTDRGVNALGQVISFLVDQDEAKLAVPRVVNSKLPWDVWTWSSAQVPNSFSARYGAQWRKYRYVLCRQDKYLDLNLMRQAAEELIGIHDFRNFSTEKKSNTVRNLMSLEMEERENFIILEAKADGFLWNMVRKMVTALDMIGSGDKKVDWIRDLLDPKRNQGVAAAPPEGLMLIEVGYPEIVNWTEDPYSKKMALERLSKEWKRKMTMAEATGEILRSML